ncbi:MAG: hypothetical protein R3Y63_07555 [Eubacteriales bacterium]
MSGRKSCEVSGLLSRGAETRKTSENSFKNTLNIVERELATALEKHKENMKFLNQCELAFSAEAESELAEEVTQLSALHKKVVSSVQNQDFSLSKIKAESEKIELRLTEIDQTTAKIHQSIRGKNDYCDSEYKQANQLLNELKSIASNRNQLASEANKMKTAGVLQAEQSINSYKQVQKYQREVEKLNEKARQIVELRQKAAEASAYLLSTIDGISPEHGNKFMKNEYAQVLDMKNRVTSLSEQELVSQFDQLQGEISKFQNTLLEKVMAFEKERDETGLMLSEVEALLTQDSFYEPLDYLKNKENAKKIILCNFLTEYASGEYVAEIQQTLQEGKKAFQEESFSVSREKSDALRSILERATDYANLKQENMIKAASVTIDIRDVMRTFNYKANATVIDGNPANGFSLVCTIGDETINFDKVYVRDDGKVQLEVDHTESASGTCRPRWTKLQEAFLEKGIPMTDVKKNNRSILYGNRQQSQNSVTEERKRM